MILTECLTSKYRIQIWQNTPLTLVIVQERLERVCLNVSRVVYVCLPNFHTTYCSTCCDFCVVLLLISQRRQFQKDYLKFRCVYEENFKVSHKPPKGSPPTICLPLIKTALFFLPYMP